MDVHEQNILPQNGANLNRQNNKHAKFQPDEASDEIFLLERSSSTTDPVEANAAAMSLHAQADAIHAELQDSVQRVGLLVYRLQRKVDVLRASKQYAKRIQATMAEDRVVINMKERLNVTQTGKALLRVAKEEFNMLHTELVDAGKRIVNATSAIALGRKVIAVQQDGVSDLSRRLQALTRKVLEADITSCEQASAFAASKLPMVRDWLKLATAKSKQAMNEMMALVVQCGNGGCMLLPQDPPQDDAQDESTTADPMRFAHEPDTTTTTQATTTAPPVKESSETIMSRFRTQFERADGLLRVLRTSQAALQRLEQMLSDAEKGLDETKESQRQAISNATSMRFQREPMTDLDSRIAQLAREIVRREKAVRKLLDKIALQRAAFLAVRKVAKARAVKRQMTQMRQGALRYQASVQERCLPLLNRADTTEPST